MHSFPDILALRKILRQGAVVAVAFTTFVSTALVHSAPVTEADRNQLVRQAERQGFASVQVSVDLYTLETIRTSGIAAIHAEAHAKVNALRAELGSDILEIGSWSNGLGQVGLLVTPAGLTRLEHSSLVKSMQPDTTRALRERAWVPALARQAIEAALAAQGVADVEIALHSDAAYRIEAAGQITYMASTADAVGPLNTVIASLVDKGLHVMDDREVRAGKRPVAKARINRAAYHALLIDPSVRAMQPAGFRPAASWSEDVLSVAKKEGSAEVVITLHGGETNSPYQGYLSEAAWKAQSEAHQQVFDALLADAGAADVSFKVFTGIGALHVRLSAVSLQRLHNQQDPRIQSVRRNRPVASPALASSAPLVNMPAAWSLGHRALGQYILVLDTGVRGSHVFFRDGLGYPRIVTDSCFGSNEGGFQSICPSQDSQGDSPVSTPGAGQPYQNASYCASYPGVCDHGTHVAGIAAGRSHPALVPSGIQGIAPDAWVVPIQVFSYPVTGAGAPKLFNADLLAALNATYAATPTGAIAPFVVNMSMSKAFYVSDCPSEDPSIAAAVANLASRGVPVIASTGNDANQGAIGWPACIPQVIKVSSVENDGVGVTRADSANIANPASYLGPILLAPGGYQFHTQVRSAISTGDNAMRNYGGTSMAAPHVSGFYAAIKAVLPSASVSDITAWVTGSGSVPVTWNLMYGTYTFQRIRAPF